MFRSSLFGAALAFTLYAASPSLAQEPRADDLRGATPPAAASLNAPEWSADQSRNLKSSWRRLKDGQKILVDRVAASFFEESLRLSQTQRIEAQTAQLYLEMTPEEQAEFRETRRQIWRSMTDEERTALRGVKRPAYANLSDAQKAPFRRTALQSLRAPRRGGSGV